MKKLFVIALLSMVFIMPFAVNAEDKQLYTTQYGVTMEKEIYDRLCDIYSVSFVETLTQSEYDKITSTDLDKIVKKSYIESDKTRGSHFASAYKSVDIIKSGNYITLMGTWKTEPNVHSFDVIAVRLSGCRLDGSFTFKQTYVSSGTLHAVYNGTSQTFSNGFGSSALLQYGSGLEYSLLFSVTGSGTVYGSYQHAMSTVSLNDSLNYTISSSGYGKVINFSPSVAFHYDQMNGVDLTV